MDEKARFTCRYVQDWDYVKALNRHIRRTDPKIRGFFWFWVVLLALCVAMMVRAGGLWGFDVFLVAFCAYRAFFRNWLKLRVSWNRTCKQKGTDRIDTTIQFGESIHVADDSGVSVDIPWPTLRKIRDSGDYFELFNGAARQGCVYVPKAGFGDGTGRAFWDWLGREHPEIERAVKK